MSVLSVNTSASQFRTDNFISFSLLNRRILAIFILLIVTFRRGVGASNDFSANSTQEKSAEEDCSKKAKEFSENKELFSSWQNIRKGDLKEVTYSNHAYKGVEVKWYSGFWSSEFPYFLSQKCKEFNGTYFQEKTLVSRGKSFGTRITAEGCRFPAYRTTMMDKWYEYVFLGVFLACVFYPRDYLSQNNRNINALEQNNRNVQRENNIAKNALVQNNRNLQRRNNVAGNENVRRRHLFKGYNVFKGFLNLCKLREKGVR